MPRAYAATALVLCLALVLSGCSSQPEKAKSTSREYQSSTPVDEKSAATVGTADGAVVVQVRKGGVAGPGQLSVLEAEAAGGVRGWQVQLNGTTLTKAATIRFQMPPRKQGEPAPVVQWADAPGGRLQVADDVQVEDGTAVVSTTHFSFWVFDVWGKVMDETGKWLRARLDDASAYNAEGKRPRCPGESEVRSAGWKITSDSGKRVFWCLGLQGGRPLLKVVNARGYAVSMESTPGVQVTATDRRDFIATLAELLRPPPLKKGNKVTLAAPGNSATYAITGSSAVGVQVDPNAGAYLLTALQYAMETFEMLLTKFGKSQLEASKSLRTLVGALKAQACWSSFQGMATTDLGSVSEVTEFFQDALGMAMGCVADAIGEADLGPILSGFVAPLVWLFTGLKTIADGLVAVGDMTTDLNGYRIIVNPPPVPATQKTVIDPFTASGQLRPGWSVDRTSEGEGEAVDCYGGSTDPSPNAVGPGTLWCGTTADSANACWPTPEGGAAVWCLNTFDLDDHMLRARRADNMGPTSTPDDPAPLFLQLSDGSVFWYRIGGSWGGRADGLNGAYGCENKIGVCADERTVVLVDDELIDTSAPAWRVLVGPLGDPDERFPPPRSMAVKRAWYIAGHEFSTD